MNTMNNERQFHSFVEGEKFVMNKQSIEFLESSVSYHCVIEYVDSEDQWKFLFILENGIDKEPKTFTLETMRGNIRYFKKLQTAIEFYIAECKKADYFLVIKDNRKFKVQEIAQ